MAGVPGNVNASKAYGLIRQLRAACEQDDFQRLRKGANKLLQRFSEDGNVRDAEFLRDTLDGRPTQRLDLSEDNPLTSLQVLFVNAATRLAQQTTLPSPEVQRTIEHEGDT